MLYKDYLEGQEFCCQYSALSRKSAPLMSVHSRISKVQTSLRQWKFALDMGSSSHWGLIITQG